jgi:hypothetical protein
MPFCLWLHGRVPGGEDIGDAVAPAKMPMARQCTLASIKTYEDMVAGCGIVDWLVDHGFEGSLSATPGPLILKKRILFSCDTE